jgi:hypothetical protein
VVLLLATCKTDGASVAVDSKDSNVKPAADAKEATHVDEQADARMGLYTQKVEPYGSVGPIGGNSAFYLTSLPGYGNLRPTCAHNRCRWEADCFLNGFNCSVRVHSVAI